MTMTDTATPLSGLDTHHGTHGGQTQTSLPALSLAALGVVYGDIGTSPLYAFREAMHATGASHGSVIREDVLGVLSLVTWALLLIVTVKYVLILLRMDNEGEGGTLSLLALIQRTSKAPSTWVVLLALLGAALFYGDAAITPAVSVLSAVEGLKLVTPALEPWILPIAIGIIFGLFLVQHRGTDAVARYFGPITLVWFIVMAAGGLWRIGEAPEVLVALSPGYAISFMLQNGLLGMVVLGSVFLAVTGAEALYADMGHFGRRPIQLAWCVVALPALLLNYFGQGALVLSNPQAIGNPFFLLFPDWALIPVVFLAAIATVIASQAVISGAFSLTQQAIQLRLLPRMRIRHTSDEHQGQIFMPGVNVALMLGVMLLVVSFGSSSALASAYGISVTGTMVITAKLAILVAYRLWRMPLWLAILMIAPFLVMELAFFAANMAKVLDGGWLTLGIAAAIATLMLSWRRGRQILYEKDREAETPLETLLRQLDSDSIATVAGTAVYLSPNPDLMPGALLHSLKHFRALHEQNVILTITTANVPRIPEDDRVEIEVITPRLRRVTLTYGYAEETDIPRALMQCRRMGWKFDIMSTSFILSRRTVRLSARSQMPQWQARLFILLSRNAAGLSDYFRIPAGRVVELGTQINI
ncbi:potassium transporter Kup [Paracoccus caeni]|nr:potassium transporter Kup [Paracoccus caeni]